LKKSEYLQALEIFEKAKDIRVRMLDEIQSARKKTPNESVMKANISVHNLYNYIGMLNEWKGKYKESVIAYEQASRFFNAARGRKISKLPRFFANSGVYIVI